MSKTAEAFRTISEVATELDVPKHVLRFWEGRFPQIRPMKRGGGRRYYRPEDLALLRGICQLLHGEGYTIKGVQKILREHGVEAVKQMGGGEPAATPKAPEPVATRGRRARATAPPPASVNDRPAKAARGLISGEARAQIEAVIAELEICRSVLLGRAIETSAKRRPGKARRSARA